MITEKSCLLQVILDLQSMMMPMGGNKEQTVSMVWDSGMKEKDSIIFYHDTHKDKQCQFSSVQSLSCVQLFAIPWTVALQASLSITNSWSLLKVMSTKLVMPSNHLIFCHPLLFLLLIFLSIRVFSSESALCIWWQKYWSFRFSISPSNEYLGLTSFSMDWLDLHVVQGDLKSLPQCHNSKASII